jgi:hypothetical protein
MHCLACNSKQPPSQKRYYYGRCCVNGELRGVLPGSCAPMSCSHLESRRGFPTMAMRSKDGHMMPLCC